MLGFLIVPPGRHLRVCVLGWGYGGRGEALTHTSFQGCCWLGGIFV